MICANNECNSTSCAVRALIKAAKGNRHGHRDATMILIGFRHGLRVSELCSLQWSSIEFETGTVYVRRAKGGQLTYIYFESEPGR